MKRSLWVIALACVMVLSFTATAMADHSPLFYFDFQAGSGVVSSEPFLDVFPPASFDTTYAIDNGSWALGTASPHSGYSQSTAKCPVCHAVHRAPTAGTRGYATPGEAGGGLNSTTGTAVTSSRYNGTGWTAEASTQMLLRSTTARSCIYCHVIEAPVKMYGGDPTLALNGSTLFGWGEFYAHTSGCTSCHAVHGANTFQGATVAPLILKASGVKNLGTIPLAVQPEVYAGNNTTRPALYTSHANMMAGSLSASATAAGVTPLQGAITAQCSICHASYSYSEAEVNTNYLNPELFQPGSWASANGTTTPIFVGNATSTVSALPGVAGITYTQPDFSNAPGSLIMKYKNHQLVAGGMPFKGSGASASFTSGNIVVSNTGSSACQSCHNAPETVVQGGYYVQSFPHYTPGYYKFMTAQNQALFDTPATAAEYMMGRQAFFNSGFGTARPGRPAVMNDGYCTKCHDTVGTMY